MKMMRVSSHQINGLKDLINDLPYNLIMIEIGCFAGESTKMFLTSGKVRELHAVDPWDEYEDYNMGEVEKLFDLNTTSLNVIKHKSTMQEALRNLPEVNFVYIDGNHSYACVCNDIQLSLCKIKSPGIIAGHNYTDFPGVKQAVNEILGEPDKIYKDSSWIYYEKPI